MNMFPLLFLIMLIRLGQSLPLSGDRIYMDDYSVLGPIDPQFGDVSWLWVFRKIS